MPSTTPLLELKAGAEPFDTESLLTRALKVFVGSAVSPIRDETNLTNLNKSVSAAVFSLSPSAELGKAIRKKGYTHKHTFIAVPSSRVPRWLVPTQSRAAIVAATQIYEPHKWVMRLLKRSLIGVTKIGWTGWCFPNILVATTDRSVSSGWCMLSLLNRNLCLHYQWVGRPLCASLRSRSCAQTETFWVI